MIPLKQSHKVGEFGLRIARICIIPLLCMTTGLATEGPVTELAAPLDVRFTAKFDGSEQRYLVRFPKDFDAKQHHGLVIALHGHGSDRWQFVNDQRDECRAARDTAAKSQSIYVSPDYRAKTSWMSPAAEADLLQILDDLHQRYRIDHVILCGGSMGGTSALAFAAMHPETMDGVVSMNGTANMVEYAGFTEAISAAYGGTKTEQPQVYRSRSAEFFPERLTMPIGLTTGGLDTLVPAESTLRLAEALKQRQSPVKQIHRPAGGHDTNYADACEAFQFVIDTLHQSSPRPKPLITPNEKLHTIVCLGDSVTGVYYHTGGRRAYPEMLEVGLHQLFPDRNIQVVNAGISGQTTQDGLARLESDVLSKNPDLVTISFGLNDMTRLTPELFRSNLKLLIQRCRDRNSLVMLCTPNAVIDTTSRPISKLEAYCDVIREVGQTLSVPVCDQYRAGIRLKSRAPWAWRLTMSDEIHPNMDGHKRMAEELCRSITGQVTSLQAVGPPRPSIPRTRALLQQRQPIRVLAMPPYDSWIEPALQRINPNAKTEVTTWSTVGKSLATLEKEAHDQVRSQKPDLVILAIPGTAKAETDEQFIRSTSWIMNWSLSFGLQEWDCLVALPLTTDANLNEPQREWSRQLGWAQDLDLIDPSDLSAAQQQQQFDNWLAKQIDH